MEEVHAPLVVDGRVPVEALRADERVEAKDRSQELDHHCRDEQLRKPRLVGVAARKNLPERDRAEDGGGGDEEAPDSRETSINSRFPHRHRLCNALIAAR